MRRLAGGLHALGVRRGDTVGFMLTNRPEFHLLDTAAMHLGAAPFSIYNTSSAEQIAYLLGDAGLPGGRSSRPPSWTALQAAIESTAGVEHLIVLDAAPEGALTLAELEADGQPGRRLRLRGRLARGRSRTTC